MRTIKLLSLLLIATSALIGCVGEPPPKDTADNEKKAKKPGLKTTTDIGEFDPGAGKEIVDDKVTYSNPVTGPLEAYQPLKDQITKMAVTRQLQAFQATEGRYPKDHAEFMDKVIKSSGIRLPALPKGRRYEYDVENHELVVVQEASKKN